MPFFARSGTLLGTLPSVFFCFGLGAPLFPALVRAGACNGLQLLFSARRWQRRSMSGTKLLYLLEPARHATCSSTAVRRSSHKSCFSSSCEHEVSECRSRSVFRKHFSSREPVPYYPLESQIVPLTNARHEEETDAADVDAVPPQTEQRRQLARHTHYWRNTYHLTTTKHPDRVAQRSPDSRLDPYHP
jgi:hypothetical protein